MEHLRSEQTGDQERQEDGVRASIIAELVRLGVARGVSPATLLDTVGEIPPGSSRVSYRSARALWSVIGDHLRQPHGLWLGAASTTTFGAFYAATYEASTVREALHVLAGMFSFFTSDGLVSIHDDPAGTRLELKHDDGVEGLGYPIEFTIGLVVRLVAGAHGTEAIRRVQFRHGPFGERADYVLHVGKCVRFEADRNLVVFDDHALDRANPRSDPLLELHPRLEIGASSTPPVRLGGGSAQIESAIARASRKGRFDLASAADELGLSPRTLQRRAKEAGVELRELLQASRRVLATELLLDRSLSIADVADRLDYADERSFNRAFERWTGLTATRWRRAH